MSEEEPIARRPALEDLINRQTRILNLLSSNPILKEVNKSALYISEASFFLIELKNRLAEHGVHVDEVDEVLAMSLARDFVTDKLTIAKVSIEDIKRIKTIPKGVLDV